MNERWTNVQKEVQPPKPSVQMFQELTSPSVLDLMNS